jgi:Alkylmercury lyase
MSAPPEQGEIVQRALSIAGIAPERFGSARLNRLTDEERALYRWILASFARGGNPAVDELCDLASHLGLEIEDTLDLLAKLDLVHHDPSSGEILVAYPFSARPRGHSVLINSTHRVEAMCAIDALGIAPMLEQPIEITSHDPLSGAEIWVRFDPGEGAWWEPATAVVLSGNTCRQGPSFRGCCDVLNFFQTDDSANTYLAAYPELAGFPISIADAIEAGRTVFADLLKEP